jgi:hypothetical protein
MPPAGKPFAAKPGAARGRSRTRRERLPPLLPLPHRRRAAAYLLFFLAGKPPCLPSPTRSTWASGHRGEDTRFLPPCGRHGLRAEAERPPLRAAAPPLVMPAIEPGWDAIFFQVPPPSLTRARHLPSLPSPLFGRRALLLTSATPR